MVNGLSESLIQRQLTSTNQLTNSSKTNAHDKLQILLYFRITAERLKTPLGLQTHVKLLIRHSKAIQILTQRIINSDAFKDACALIEDVRRSGIDLYPDGQKSKSYSKWITINSHYMSHLNIFCELFGSPRNTWVFAYESFLGVIKRIMERCRNGKSQGIRG